jgi:hypothetical protein
VDVLLQPYVDLQEKWNTSYKGEKYQESGKLQVRAAAEASSALLSRDG